MKYFELLNQATDLCHKENKEDGAAKLLLLHITKLESHILISKLKEDAPTFVVEQFNTLMNKYVYENIPVQHLTGVEFFFGYEFNVNEDVLIPRFETEELVSNILMIYDEVFEGKEVQVVDIGTGSGAIAITLDLEEPNMNVTATDISEDALKVAKSNNEKLNANVNFLQGDMLAPIEGMKFDILVSNPPYIPQDEVVDSLVYDNEPHVALFGGNDGLHFYKIILENAKQYLNLKSILAFEHAYDKGEDMVALAKEHFPTSEVQLLKDMQGKDRMTIVINR